MSRKDKLIQRLKSYPKDFSFEELATLMGYFGYKLDNGGKTSGSFVKFVKEGRIPFKLHKPHAYKCLLHYSIKDLLEYLEKENLL